MRVAVLLLPLLLDVASPRSAGTARRNVVSRVEVTRERGRLVVTIVGSRPPNFTSFSTAHPPRFVIDLFESAFRGVRPRIEVGGDVVTAVETSAITNGGAAIARVSLAFRREVAQPDVETAGAALRVSVRDPVAAPPLVATAPREEPDAKVRAADAERRARVEAERRAQAEVEAEAKARAEARARAEEEEAARARAVAEARARDEAVARARAEAEQRARAEAERPSRARPDEDAARRLAAARPSRTARPDQLRGAGARLHVRELGFRQLEGMSRVFVRLSGPPRFSIGEPSEDVVRIELPNTDVQRRNDARRLDTSFFPGAVATVTPRQHGTSVVIEVALKARVRYRQGVDGDTLYVDFDPPGAR